MLMCCIDGGRWTAMSDQGRDAVMRDYGAWIAEMEHLGKHVASARLAPPSTAQTLRLQGGRRQVVDERIPTPPHGGVVEVRAVEGPA